MAIITSYTVSVFPGAAPESTSSFVTTITLAMFGDHPRPWEVLRWPTGERRVLCRSAIQWRAENPGVAVIPEEFFVRNRAAGDERFLFTLAEAMFVCGVTNHR